MGQLAPCLFLYRLQDGVFTVSPSGTFPHLSSWSLSFRLHSPLLHVHYPSTCLYVGSLVVSVDRGIAIGVTSTMRCVPLDRTLGSMVDA